MGVSLFSHVESDRMKGNGVELHQRRFTLDIRKKKSWKGLSSNKTDCPGSGEVTILIIVQRLFQNSGNGLRICFNREHGNGARLMIRLDDLKVFQP